MIGPKLATARAAGALSRRAGRGGTSLPGKVLLRLEPEAIATLSARLPHGSVAISATNGKTTTAAIVAAILARAEGPVVHNVQGANMAGGVASALLDASHGKRIDGEIGLFEVDEFWLDRVAPQLQPRALLLGNLFRDQLDRYGELETIADRWAAVLDRLPGTRLVLNADDPLVADLGLGREEPLYFGIDDDNVALAHLPHASDSKHCRRCGTPLAYDAVYVGHLGRWHCPRGDSARPSPAVTAANIRLEGTRGAQLLLRTPDGDAEVRLGLPGLYNVYNAVGAAALALALGIGLDDIVAGLEEVRAAFGRAETVRIDGRDLAILLVKNPTGANEVLRTLALEPGEIDLLAVLNDNVADGRDVSWIWDADLELLAGSVRRVVCSGTRAPELALRLKYAGIEPERIEVIDDLEAGLDAALDGAGDRLYAMPTYTAMLALRELLARRGSTAGMFT
ncbi:MAG: MurT ligase domain-containing protein [Solirubrobacteraceae bacterium]